ncbi:type II toxin-antitoxin system VapC family toxin [Kribbella sp. CA-294648]|uniref:type II toxin-antitoxin system VapC family toxin n=1 Tax=Kribbella sp. CA-294648 TaxID=3239948 RepID=UPI003D8E566E
MIVFDTNVASELMKVTPDEAVWNWIVQQSRDELCITAITVTEIRYGIERIPAGRRKVRMSEAADLVFDQFGGNILPFDTAAAEICPQVILERERKGLPIEPFDAQIAAICRAGQMALATRNIKDFLETGVELVNPWE